MTKQRSNYLYELVGIVRESKIRNLKNRECLNLIVELTNYPEISTTQAFKDKLKEQIWTDLNNKKFIDKKYLFKCQNYLVIFEDGSIESHNCSKNKENNSNSPSQYPNNSNIFNWKLFWVIGTGIVLVVEMIELVIYLFNKNKKE